MRGNVLLSILRWVALLLLFLTAVLTGWQLVRYSRIRSTFPPGLKIAEVSVGGLDQQEAAERLVQAYACRLNCAMETLSFRSSRM